MQATADSPAIFIVIPVLNRWEQTRRCLQALFAGHPAGFRVIVVDHGSTDGTAENLAQEFPAVTRLAGNPGMWWTAATNCGIRYALEQDADLVMLLNNDCYLRTDTLARLLDGLDRQPGAIIAPLQADLQNGEIDRRSIATCFLLGFPTLRLPGTRVCHDDTGRPVPTRLVMGGRGTLIPATLFRRIGLFDEDNLPHYGADHDFYLRAHKSGTPLLLACGAVVDVDGSSTTRASGLGNMRIGEFLQSLRDRRSHRNIRELTTLFRLHYPLPGLYPVGVALNLLRYTLVFLAARIAALAGINNDSRNRSPAP